MRFTRRILEGRARVIAAGCALSAAAWSCSSGDEAPAGDVSLDAGADAVPGDTDLDAGTDANRPRDAAPFDAAPLPVVCDGQPCAVALVTTLGASDADRAEGFCALLDDGTVACWGANGAGQLGRGDDAGPADDATPARVVGLADVVALDHTCALDANGEAFCWGTGPFLRDDSPYPTTERTPVKLPIPRAKAVSTGVATTCAAVDEGVLCWGANRAGQIAPSNVSPWYTFLGPTLVAMPAGAPVRDLVVANASFAVREDGTTVSWGANPPLARTSPMFPDPYPQPIALEGVSNMDVALDNACAVAHGQGWCWGVALPRKSGGGFQLPSGPNVDRALPEPIVAPEPLLRIATTRTIIGEDLGVPVIQPQRWCGSAASGALYCWGHNAAGQVGNGTTTYADAAVKIDLPGPTADVRTTPDATCALATNGKIHCWGSNAYGQLGTGKSKVPSLVPQEVVLP